MLVFIFEGMLWWSGKLLKRFDFWYFSMPHNFAFLDHKPVGQWSFGETKPENFETNENNQKKKMHNQMNNKKKIKQLEL